VVALLFLVAVAVVSIVITAGYIRFGPLRAECNASARLCGQLQKECYTYQMRCNALVEAQTQLQAYCEELDAERLALVDTLYRENGPERVAQILEDLRTKRDLRTPTEREPEPSATTAALAGGDQAEFERLTTIPSTPEDTSAHRRLVRATANDVDTSAETQVLSKDALRAALGAAAGGATLPPSSMPRSVRAGPVAPPSSAPPSLSGVPGVVAATLGPRPQGSGYSSLPAPLQGTQPRVGVMPPKALPVARTLLSMPAVTPSPSVCAPATAAFRDEPRDTVEMIATRKPDDADGKATKMLEWVAESGWEPPMYALLQVPFPSAHVGELGSDGVPKAGSGRRLGPDEKTPRTGLLLANEADK
jgi:hypothetical protein